MVTASKSSETVVSMKECGNSIKQTVKANLSTRMEKYTRALGKTTVCKAGGVFSRQMALRMQASGWRTSNTDEGLSAGLMAPIMRANTN